MIELNLSDETLKGVEALAKKWGLSVNKILVKIIDDKLRSDELRKIRLKSLAARMAEEKYIF